MRTSDDIASDLRKILDHYDQHINPVRKPGEWRIFHFFKRFHSQQCDLHFSGSAGRKRYDNFVAIVNKNQEKSPRALLVETYNYAIQQHQLSTNSILARNMLDFIGKELGLKRYSAGLRTSYAAMPGSYAMNTVESDMGFYCRIGRELAKLPSNTKNNKLRQ